MIRRSGLLGLCLLATALLASCSGGGRRAASNETTQPTASPRPSAVQAPARAASDSPSSGTSVRALILEPTPAKAAPNVPPQEGTYTYSQSGQAKIGEFTFAADPTGTLEVERATASAEGQRQTHTRKFSSSRQQTQAFHFTPRAVWLEETTTTFGGQTQRCRTTTPIEAVRLPLAVGSSWSGSGTCDGGSVSFTARILRAEAHPVGDTSVNTYVVHHKFHVVIGDSTEDLDLTSWLSPDYRLSVHSVQHATGTVQGVPFTEDLTEDLQNLAPAR